MSIKCLICYKEFKNDGILSRHLKNEHQMSRKYYADMFLHLDNICPFCGKEKNFSHIKYLRTCNSKECINKLKEQIYMEKYGVLNPGQRECQKEISRHVFDNKDKNDQRNIKTRETSLKKYGTESPNQSPDVKKKIKNTLQEKYGVDCPFQLDSCKKNGHTRDANYRRKETLKKNLLKKYGVDNVARLDSVKDKIKQTKEQRYGDPNFCNHKLAEETMMQNYGVAHYAQTEEFAKKHRSRIKYNGYNFDSSLEVYFYKICVEYNINSEVKPTKIAFYSNQKLHYYFPDFSINGQLYECKGRHFLKYNENGEIIGLYNPYISKLLPEEIEMKQLYEMDKYQCMVKNKVIILSSFDEIEKELRNN